MDKQDLPVAVLYSSPGSVWASAPRLLLVEKNYSPEEYSIKDVNVRAGENYDPSYLKLNVYGHVPTLVVPVRGTTAQDVDTKFRAINDSVDICEFLDKARTSLSTAADAAPAPALSAATIDTKQQQDALIKLVHAEAADPNAALILPANEEELAAKSGIKTMIFSRQDAIEKFAKSAEAQADERLAKFYSTKLEQNSLLKNLYAKKLPEEAKQAIFEKVRQLWQSIGKVLSSLEAQLGVNSPGGFALGEALSLADIHLAVWLARIAFAAGAKDYSDPNQVMDKLQAKTGTVGPLTRAYFGNLTTRASFKQVYADGLH